MAEGEGVELRPFSDEEVPTALRLLATTFMDAAEEADAEAERTVLETARSHAAFVDGEMVGCLGCYSHHVSVPGGEVPAAGTTWVSVLPTHRRRGILTRLMRAHLEEVRERGEPLAMLWASEMAIYGRWGYGLATEGLTIRLDVGPGLAWASTAPPAADRVRMLPLDPVEEAVAVLEPIHEACRRRRPGMHRRTSQWWAFQRLTTRPGVMEGLSDRRVAVARTDGRDVAYAVYGAKGSWSDHGRPRGTLSVVELMGVDGPSEAAMWRFLAAHDLVSEVVGRRRPVDDPLPLLLADPRRARRTTTDGLHVRVMDVPAALGSRGYAASAGVTVEVVDPVIEANDGTWRVEVAPEGAMVEPADGATPDLRMPVTTLGSLYLGGMSATRLASAGMLEVADPEALHALDAALRSPEAPWGPEVW